jgi:hypothetical protein
MAISRRGAGEVGGVQCKGVSSQEEGLDRKKEYRHDFEMVHFDPPLHYEVSEQIFCLVSV